MQLTTGKGSKQKRCGRCYGCKVKDCGVCRHCLDKKKFGGPNRLKQCCIHKKCAEYKDTAPKRPPLMQVLHNILLYVHVYTFLNYPGVCTDDRKITTEAFVRVSWHKIRGAYTPITVKAPRTLHLHNYVHVCTCIL